MNSIASIPLPLFNVVEIHDEETVFDAILDMKIDDLIRIITWMDKETEPKIASFNQGTQVFGLLMSRPPEAWKLNEEEKFIMVIGPSIPKLAEYYSAKQTNSPDQWERHVCQNILTILSQFHKSLQERRKQQIVYNYGGNTTSTY